MSSVVKGVKKLFFGESPKLETYYPSVPAPSATEKWLSDQIKSQYEGLLPNINLGTAFSNAKTALSSIAAGELPQSYQDALNSFIKTQMGGLLSNYARRGILNSSLTEKAISDTLMRANDLRANYLSQAANLAMQPYQLSASALQMPYDWYRTLMSARYSLRSQPYVSGGSSGLLGGLVGGLGRAAGGWLAGKIF
jgi:hypothetical protein